MFASNRVRLCQMRVCRLLALNSVVNIGSRPGKSWAVPSVTVPPFFRVDWAGAAVGLGAAAAGALVGAAAACVGLPCACGTDVAAGGGDVGATAGAVGADA